MRVKFLAGYFNAEQFPSWAGQSLEYLDVGVATTLGNEENASDTVLSPASFNRIPANFGGDDFEGESEGDLVDVKLQGIHFWFLITQQTSEGDTIVSTIAFVSSLAI